MGALGTLVIKRSFSFDKLSSGMKGMDRSEHRRAEKIQSGSLEMIHLQFVSDGKIFCFSMPVHPKEVHRYYKNARTLLTLFQHNS